MVKLTGKKRGFSLVEMAIFIVIVGIVIAAILQASTLIRSFKIMGARAQTRSSAINNIPGIVAWYDTTSETSFLKQEAFDGKRISEWHDVNSQATVGNHATQSLENAKPLYVFDSLIANGLPVLRFSGKEYFKLPDGTVPHSNYNYTFFLVMRVYSTSESYGVLGSGNYFTKDSCNMINYRAGGFIENNWQSNSLLTSFVSVSTGKMQIFTFSYDNARGRKIYVNNNLKGEDYAVNRNSSPFNNTIGKASVTDIAGDLYFKGDIAEIILFGRTLEKEERHTVEKYLAKKWTITL